MECNLRATRHFVQWLANGNYLPFLLSNYSKMLNEQFYQERRARAQAMLNEAEKLKRQGKHREAGIATAAAMDIDPTIFHSGAPNAPDFTSPFTPQPFDIVPGLFDRKRRQRDALPRLTLIASLCILYGLRGIGPPLFAWASAAFSSAATAQLQNAYAQSWTTRNGFGPSSAVFFAGVCALICIVSIVRQSR